MHGRGKPQDELEGAVETSPLHGGIKGRLAKQWTEVIKQICVKFGHGGASYHFGSRRLGLIGTQQIAIRGSLLEWEDAVSAR
jgi:hypothetical protein